MEEHITSSTDETLEEIRVDLKAVGFPLDLILVHGTSASSVTYLALYMTFAGVVRRMPIIFLDGGNSFDPYLISKLSRHAQCRPEELLSRIYISRAFTCHQMQALVVDRLEAALRKYSTSAVIVSGLLDTFFDEAVPFGEAFGLLKIAVAELVRLAGNGAHILLACPDTHLPLAARQKAFTGLLKKSSSKVIRCENAETESRFILEKPYEKMYRRPKLKEKTDTDFLPLFGERNVNF